jgi:hypothetical protein
MSRIENVEYLVVLVFPGFGDERENAEQIIEEALHYLNTEKDEPGMRFAQNVTARLETVTDAEDALDRLRTDDDLAVMILHGLPDDEKTALTKKCAAKGIGVCHTLEAEENPRRKPRPRRRIWKVVLGKLGADGPRAHTISETTLIAPLDGDQEELMDRVGQLITVLALGVMQVHWTRNPPKYSALE